VNWHWSDRTSLQSGMTLLACSMVLFGVALLASASLRSQQDNISLTYSAVDRLIAQQAADSALQDAAMSLSITPPDDATISTQGSHHFGDITGQHFPFGGPAQSCAAPEYLIEPLAHSGNAGAPQDEAVPYRYRVTATGLGLSRATSVVLQAEFEVQACTVPKNEDANDKQGESQNSMGNAVQSAEPASGQRDTNCNPYVRRLAWRMLRTT